MGCSQLKGWQIGLIVAGTICCCISVILIVVLSVVLTIKLTNPCADIDFFDDQNNGQVNNIVISTNQTVFGTLGDQGVGVWMNVAAGVNDGAPSLTLPLPTGTDQANDVALDDTNALLFVLDADADTGDLWVVDVNTMTVVLQSGGLSTVSVSTGTLSGLAVDSGLVLVSGGENPLTVLEYDPATGVIANTSQINFGRGTPDVYLIPGLGFPRMAVVSTHFTGFPGSGADYGVTLLEIPQPPATPIMRGSLVIDDTGFTRGTLLPSNWPTKTTQLPTGELVVAHCEGITVLDISDPDNLQVVARQGLSTSAVDIVSSGTTVYVVGSEPVSRVFELDLSDPVDPVQVFDMQLSGDATSVHVSSNPPSQSLVVVATGSAGIFGLNQ